MTAGPLADPLPTPSGASNAIVRVPPVRDLDLVLLGATRSDLTGETLFMRETIEE
jgi:hypothetical protein